MGNLLTTCVGEDEDKKYAKLFTERYKVGVVAGTHKFSGLDAEITVVVIGRGGRSAPQVLKRPVPGHHSGPHVEVFHLETNQDMQDIGAVEVFNSGKGLGANWELIKVVVDKVMEGGLVAETYWERWVFPCYSWVSENTSRLYFTGMPASVPSRTPYWLVKQRELALEKARKNYQYAARPGLPAGLKCKRVDDLPRDEHLPHWHEKDFKVATANHIIRKGLSHMLGDGRLWTTMDEMSEASGAILGELFTPEDELGEVKRVEEGDSLLPRPPSAREGPSFWKSDVAFGRQFTQGIHSTMLEVCREVPPELVYGLPLTSIRFRTAYTLADEAKDGRVYKVDYSFMREYIDDPLRGNFLAAPVCYFYMMEDPQHEWSEDAWCLLPVAIVLEPHVPDAPIFTPDDGEWDWVTAKAFVLNADSQYHMVVAYYLKTFAVAEPFVVSMHRQLSVMHPIHKLLRSYSQGCLAYTTMARESLVGEGGVLQHTFSISEQLQPLLRDAYQRWRFEDFAFPFSLAMRGFDGRETFPDYPHREDGLLVWSAIVDFVKDYINLYYPSERSVREDKELQAWYQESFEVGHGELLNSGQLEVGPLDGRDALAKTMVFLVWNFTAANASLTRPSYDAYAYPPARPTVLHAPPPQAKGECTEDSFLRMLPTRGESAVAVGFMHWRSERTTLAAPLLGPQVDEQILDPDGLECFDRFQESLRLVQRVIESRNDKREVGYLFMMPSLISCGLVH